jgi:hypothetical protein
MSCVRVILPNGPSPPWTGLARLLLGACGAEEGLAMMNRDVLCALCDRVVLADVVLLRVCEGCSALICYEHSGEPYGVHDPEDHISPDDAEDAEEPLAVSWSYR